MNKQNATNVAASGPLEPVVRWLFTPRFYAVYTDWNGCTASVKCTKQEDLDRIIEATPNFDWIECGPITYWLMKHRFYRLAMIWPWR